MKAGARAVLPNHVRPQARRALSVRAPSPLLALGISCALVNCTPANPSRSSDVSGASAVLNADANNVRSARDRQPSPGAIGSAVQGSDSGPAAGRTGAGTTSHSELMQMHITVGSKVFVATLHDNATARAFKAMLPLRLNMTELNANEKFHELPRDLPTAASKPGTIHGGDLMLYGSNTVVLFYKSFSTQYSYSPIGKLDDASGLAAALGTGNVTVTFAP